MIRKSIICTSSPSLGSDQKVNLQQEALLSSISIEMNDLTIKDHIESLTKLSKDRNSCTNLFAAGSEEMTSQEVHANIRKSIQCIEILSDKGREEDFLSDINQMSEIIKDELANADQDQALSKIAAYEKVKVAYRYVKQSRFDEALLVYLECLEDYSKACGADSKYVGGICAWIAYVYQHQHKYTQSLEYHHRSLHIYKTQLAKAFVTHKYNQISLRISTSLNNIASIYFHLHDFEKALVYYEEALAIRLTKLDHDHIDIAGLHNNIASVLEAQEKYFDALVDYKKALRIYLKNCGNKHPRVAMVIVNLGNVYQMQGRYELSLQLYEKALQIYTVTGRLDDHHPNVSLVYTKMAFVYYQQCNQLMDEEPCMKGRRATS